MSWYLYILRCSDGTLYTGITDNIPRRLAAHRAGRGARYTRGRSPLTLVYQEEWENRGAASRREAAVKKMTRAQKEKLISRGGEENPLFLRPGPEGREPQEGKR